ncbi:MAG: host attachment protein [Acidobacteria bacterium]|nr:host attachment protein [Acidobacteriota bacterium]
MSLRSPQRLSVEADTERITTYLRDQLRPSSNGVAIFACAGAADFFEAMQLDAPFAEHRLHVADRPHLYPLARLADQHPPYAALIADTNAARLFVFGRGVTLRSDEVQGTKVSRTSVGGWSQARYQRHVENYHLKHAKELVEALDQVVREDGVEQIVLAGDEVITPVLRKQLPKHLNDRIIDVLRLDITTPEHQILKATTDALREHDGDTDADEVRRLLDQYRAGQLAVVGALATLTALTRGQVDVLLISASPDAVHDDTDTDAQRPGDPDANPGETVPIVERLVGLARTTGARVTFIEDPALLADMGGVGAMLRYRIQPVAPATGQTRQETR